MLKNKFDLAILIGRLHPPHEAHMSHIRLGLKNADRVLILPGSAQEERTFKNPLTFFERAEIVLANFQGPEKYRLMFRPLRDFKRDEAWVAEVKHQASLCLETVGIRYEDANIALLGTNKDDSSWYLKEFPFYKHIGHPEPLLHNGKLISATDIRKILFQKDDNLDELKDIMSQATINALRQFRETDGWHIVMSKL